MLTKTNFLLFLQSPMHLWAATHGKLENDEASEFNQFLKDQGYDVEEYAQRFIHTILLPRYPEAELIWQHTYHAGEFSCRSDAIVYDKKDKVYDIFEIKQSTHVDVEHEYDLTFQTLIYEANFPVRNVHILHLNKDYVRHGDINLEQLFVINNLNDQVNTRKPEVLLLREQAAKIVDIENPLGIERCAKPGTCPCPALCHPELPEYSIYELMGARSNTLMKLRELNITKLTEISEEISLNERQRHQIQAVKDRQPYTDIDSISNELKTLTYPLYFLDYETCSFAVPRFEGYKPQQKMVFQYSLHIVSQIGEISHKEYLSITKNDPSISLLQQLSTEIGNTGSVIVWNKTFEYGRNKEMAKRYPQYREFLESVNNRMYDLAESIKKGYLIHPDFHGSWSIKHILPILAEGHSYKGMAIAKGDQAMAEWLKLISSLSDDEEADPDWLTKFDDQTIKDMLKYCELDTLAMVEIWRHLVTITSAIQQPITALQRV